MKIPVALVIMDGYGYSKEHDGNAIYTEKTQNLVRLSTDYPCTLMRASGLDVGLPDGQMGNSEVGHTNIGAGRIVYQPLTRITKSIQDGTLMRASGLDVGLPDGQMGNSEVGHTNIGAGRIVYQPLTRITKSIQDGDFFTNEVLCQAMENAKENALHIMGLLSDGGVHSQQKKMHYT